MTSSSEHKTADRKKLADRVAAFKKQTETAKKAAKAAKAAVKQAKLAYKEARSAAKRIRKATKALEAELASFSTKERPRKASRRTMAPKRTKLASSPAPAPVPVVTSDVNQTEPTV